MHVVTLFVSIFKDALFGASGWFNRHFREYPPTDGCLRFAGTEDSEFKGVAAACVALGSLFYYNVVDAAMTVGEAAFDPINAPQTLTGHAFGTLHSDETGIIVEGTIWDMTSDLNAPEPLRKLVEGAFSAAEAAAARILQPGDTAQSESINVRKVMPLAVCDATYAHLYTAADCLLFSAGARAFGVTSAALRTPLPVVDEVFTGCSLVCL